MADKIFFLVATGDKDVILETALFYPLTVAKEKYMDEVKVILYGPVQKLAAEDIHVQKRIKRLQEEGGIEILSCKYCADKWGLSEKMEELGFTNVYVSPIIAKLLKEGWHSLSF